MPAIHSEDISPLRSSEAPSLGEGMLLSIQAPDHPPQQVHLRSPRCSIGAARDCTLRLVAEGVQPIHCVIERWQTQARVQRLAPQTWLNGQDFHSALLRPGDRLQVGPIEIQLLALGPEPKQAPSPEVDPPMASHPQLEETASESLPASPELASSELKVEQPVQSARPPVPASDQKLRLECQREQTARRLGHQRAKRLVGLVRQARKEMDRLQTQIEQLQRDIETLQAQEANLRIQVEQHSALQRQAQEWAEIESRIHRRQQDLDRREAQLESQRQALEHQQAQWKAEQIQLQQELQHRADILNQQRAELLQAQTTLHLQLQELQSQQQELQQQQQLLQQQQQTLQQHQQAVTQKEQELAEWQERLETHQQALAEQEASLVAGQQAFQKQQELFQTEQEQWQDQKSQPESPPPEASMPRERMERYTQPPEPRSASHAEEILRRLGMMPNFEEEGDPGVASAPLEDKSSSEETTSSHSGQKTSNGADSEEDAIIHSYMERLLGREWKQATQSSCPEEEPISDPCLSAGRGSRHAMGDFGSEAGKSRPGYSRGRATAEWVPRAVAPEREVDLEAMRTLANLSACSAIEQHHRRKTQATVWAKFLLTVLSLALGCGMLWVWGGKREHNLALYAAGACFAVAALWGVQYGLLALKLAARSFGYRSPREPSPAGEEPPFPSAPSLESFGEQPPLSSPPEPFSLCSELPEDLENLPPSETALVSSCPDKEKPCPSDGASSALSPEDAQSAELGKINPSASEQETP